jgi:hypothetical protein
VRLPAALLVAATLAAAPAAGEEVRSERAGMLLVSPDDGGDWEDAGDEDGPALVSRDIGGRRLGARAVELESPAGLEGLDRPGQAEYLVGYLEEIIENSYGPVKEPEGPFYFGDEGPLVVSWEFLALGRHNREYLVWDSVRLLNLTIWCRAGLADGLEDDMNALLARFRW